MKKPSTGMAILAFLIGFCAFFLIMGQAVKAYEKAECERLQVYSKSFVFFYLTQAEKDQCDAYNIQIDAPVK